MTREWKETGHIKECLTVNDQSNVHSQNREGKRKRDCKRALSHLLFLLELDSTFTDKDAACISNLHRSAVYIPRG